MGKWKKLLPVGLIALALMPLLYLYATTLQFGVFGEWREMPAIMVEEVLLETEGQATEVALPYIMEDGEAGQVVTLTTQLTDCGALRLYFKSVFSPLRIYANDVLIYDFGGEGSYPSYLQDPATKTVMIELPDEALIDLRFEYTYPTTRSDLVLDTIMVGTYPAIFNGLLDLEQTYLALYLLFFGMGVVLISVGFLIRTIERQGIFFVWLGLITLCCGLWGLGEYDMTGIFIQNESLVSLITFTSVFYLPIPIHCFFRSTVGYHDPRPIRICIIASFTVATASVVLQATSLVSFYSFMSFFQWFAVASFCFGIGYTIREWRAYDNEMARRFLMPWCLVGATALVEGLQFTFGNINAYGQFTQIALLVFIIINCFIGASLIQKAAALRVQHQRIEQEYKLMEVQVASQQRYQHLLMETRETLRQQRHDLHHQLAVLRHLAGEGNLAQLSHHLDAVVSQIPELLETHCEHIAVNAVVDYYVSKAKDKGIAISVELAVPAVVERIDDGSLCVIFGNILENAIEACGRMSGGGGFISLHSHIRNGMLVITQKNSFEGAIRNQGEKFYSSKRDDFGVGLTSVQTVAHKHSGNATFMHDGRVFQSTIYVRI